MTEIWTLLYGATEQTFADWGLRGAKFKLLSQAIDEVTFTAPGDAVDGTPLFAFGGTVTIKRSGTTVFVGTVTSLPGQGAAAGESVDYTISGPWYLLERRPYKQAWAIQQTDGSYVEERNSHVMLGQRLYWDGAWAYPGGTPGTVPTTTYASISQAVQDILAWAVYCGDAINYDLTNLPATVPPVVEDRDMTCANAIRRMLRWVPDVVAYWDYTTSPPTLYFSTRSTLTPVSFAIGEKPLSEVHIAPRPDLQVPCVQILYERTDTVDGVPYPLRTWDKYPGGATGNESGALCATVDLKGGSVTTVSGMIEARKLDATQIANKLWWAEKLPNLTEGGGDNQVDLVTISGAARFPGSATYANEMTDGAFAPWMRLADGNPVLCAEIKVICRACIQYTTRDGLPDVRWEDLAVKVKVTNAPCGVAYEKKQNYYTTVTAAEDAEQPPTGLAQNIYESLATLQYSGAIMLRERECGETAMRWVGKSINITGSANAAWATMAAMVQSADMDIDAGTTTLTIGPPEHLAPQDIVTLLSMTRYRYRWNMPASMASGALQAGGEAAHPTKATTESTHPAVKSWETFTLGSGGSGSLVGSCKLDATPAAGPRILAKKVSTDAFDIAVADLMDGATMHAARFRKLRYCNTDGSEKDIFVLCSRLFDTGNPAESDPT